MRSKFSFKFIAIIMLAVGFAAIPTVYFSEPAVAAAKRRAKKKTGKKRTAKRRRSTGQGAFYRCARCGEWSFQGADPRLDFVYRLSQCRYGGMHSWRKVGR